MPSLSVSFHKTIEDYNVLENPTTKVQNFLNRHPTVYKIALLAMHIFRAVAMIALAVYLPFTPQANLALCFAGSLIYRLVVEDCCNYKFALPAFAGSLVLPHARPGLLALINGVAFASADAFQKAMTTVLPLAGYLTYIVLTVDYDVDRRVPLFT